MAIAVQKGAALWLSLVRCSNMYCRLLISLPLPSEGLVHVQGDRTDGRNFLQPISLLVKYRFASYAQQELQPVKAIHQLFRQKL